MHIGKRLPLSFFGPATGLLLMLCFLLPGQGQNQPVQPGRVEDAKRIIDQIQSLKPQVKQYRTQLLAQINSANSLSKAAKKLNKQGKSLNASVQQSVITGGVNKSDAEQFELHLAEFRRHANLYNLHLADYEKQLLQARATSGQLQSQCNQYASHVRKYHIPNVNPPHMCPILEGEEGERQKMEAVVKEYGEAGRQAEQQLANEESKLQDLVKSRVDLQRKLLEKSSVASLENGRGRMVLKEYEQLEREYAMLEAEKKRLGLK